MTAAVIPSLGSWGENTAMKGMQVEATQLFHAFRLDDHVPADHRLWRLDRFLELDSLRSELRPFYSSIGRPSIDLE